MGSVDLAPGCGDEGSCLFVFCAGTERPRACVSAPLYYCYEMRYFEFSSLLNIDFDDKNDALASTRPLVHSSTRPLVTP